VVWFAWLDAHTQASSYNNLRLDHYVYTEESMQEAKRLLADDGVLFVNFNVIRPWIGDRLFVLLRRVFGHDPLMYQKIQPAGLGKSRQPICARQHPTTSRVNDLDKPGLREAVASNLVAMPGATRPTTDNWPYLYLQRARIPKLHLLTNAHDSGHGRSGGHGANLIQGRTRLAFLRSGRSVSASGSAGSEPRYVIVRDDVGGERDCDLGGVLVMVLAANVVAARWPRLPHGFIVGG